ncbi:TonB-dependent receptor [Leptolyngbya sp. 15MV]|nr:TonB-dependent receptor [Leptolyngbya sp. 15MV]
MNFHATGHRALLLAGAAAFAIPSAVQAQDVDAAPQAERANTGNEIIVTATKREQTLQEIPVAVSVTTAETIERNQVRDLRDLQTLVPSLKVAQLQSSANTNFLIRGFGNGANNAGIEPSVGVFVDGVYRSRSASQITDLPDVERVEVLRGPQSTLFGKNASAGVISIVTKKPEFQFGGLVEASYGNYDAIVGKGLVTGPISQNIAFSLAGGVNKRDGYLTDLGTGNRSNDRDRWFARGQLLFEGNGPLSVRLIGDYDKIDEICCGVVNLQRSAASSAVIAVGGQLPNPADPFADVIYSNFDSTNDIKNWGLSGQVDLELGALTLTSITGYRESRAITNQDSDFTSADLIGRKFDDVGLETFTQEVRLSGGIGDRINFLLGGFYFKEDIDQANEIFFGDDFRPYASLLGVERPEVVVEELHAELLSGLDHRVDSEGLALADQVRDGGGDHQELVAGDHTRLVDPGAEHLREHAEQRGRELDPDLVLLGDREGIDDAVDGLGGPGGVEGSEDKVAGLGGADGGLDRLEVTHLAHEDHVWVLSEHSSQRLGEAWHIDVHLALVDDRLLVLVVILDRVFHRHDVAVVVLVDVVDHRRQRGGLARSGRPGDQEHPSWSADELAADLWQADGLERQQLAGDEPEHHREVPSLSEDGDAEAGHVAVGEPEVRAADLLKLELVALGRDRLHERHHVVGVEHLGLQVLEVLVVADGRATADREVEVGAVHLDNGVEQSVDLYGGHVVGPVGRWLEVLGLWFRRTCRRTRRSGRTRRSPWAW